MNNWKHRIIAYITALDESLSPEEADQQIHDELVRIKEDCPEKPQETVNDNDKVSNYAQLDRSMGMPELIALYRDLFYGRQDVFAVRWNNEKTGAHGYAPKCKNEWDRNICGKSQRIKGACKSVRIEKIIAAKAVYTEYGIESYIERSRSGNGGHLWLFFSERVEAHIARKLGVKVLETTM